MGSSVESSGVADGDGRRRRGEAGAVVNECGEGAEGGGRWMNVRPGASESSLMIAFVDVVSGSRGRGSGFSARRVAYVRISDRDDFGRD